MKISPKLALLAAAVFVLVMWAVRFCGTKVEQPVSSPTTVTATPTIIPRGTVAVSTPQPGKKPRVERIKVPDADRVNEVVTVGETRILVQRPPVRLFPDFRTPRSLVRVLDGPDSTVVTTLQRQPLFDAPLKPTLGVRYDGNNLAPSAGLELIRVGPVLMGASTAFDPARKQVEAGPEAGVRVTANLGLYAGKNMLGDGSHLALRYRF